MRDSSNPARPYIWCLIVLSRLTCPSTMPFHQGSVIPSSCAEVIGIDDFAFEKGHRYGTIICDVTTHRPIALLRTREAHMLTDWLVNLVKRPVRASIDHFPAYQEALLDRGIVVVSDRFHLVDNLWRCLNSICKRVLSSRIPVNSEGSVSYGLKPQHPTEPGKGTKRPLVERVQSMHRQGMNLNAVARMVNLNWKTVKNTVIRFMNSPHRNDKDLT